MKVTIRSIPLYAISDHVSRKSQFEFGVLIGNQFKTINISDAFELKTEGNLIDFEYLTKRLSMMQSENQQVEVVGLYTVSDRDTIPDFLWDQFLQRKMPIPPIYVCLRNDKLQCIDRTTREALDLRIVPAETEEIVTETIRTHKQAESGLLHLASGSEADLLESISNLRERTLRIIHDDGIDADKEMKLVYLANLVREAPHFAQDESMLLISTQLALLTNEISAIKALDIENSRKIAGYLIGILKDRPR